ncbi:MAG: hypothetical protein KGJ13_12805, partial [Patescibacteria group bacterium]|nr:hypothetical protein [Patescibacteria group bacterium]
WELSGQAAAPILNALADEKAAATFGSSNVLPAPTSTICLFGVTLEGSGVTFSGIQNFTLDQSALATTGSLRAGKMGHATATAAVYGVLFQMSASTTFRPSYCLVTA